jgi:type IV pilus assembly protein PilY1
MKRLLYIALCSICLLGIPLFSEGQTITSYCQLPSSIGTPIDPNLLLVIDQSGSMGYCAYTSETGGGSCENSSKPYVATTTYEGYFNPAKSYALDVNGVYVETTPTGLPCVTTCDTWTCKSSRLGDCDSTKGTHSCNKKYACCSHYTSSGDCDLVSGNYLNYTLMRRVDILRWALTGGRLNSCNNTVQTCDPEVYPNSQLSCDSAGCILLTSEGTQVKVPWARITGKNPTTGNDIPGSNPGLLFQLKDLSPKPLIGAMFFDGTSVRKTVYIGDFTSSASYEAVHPYKNVITSVNYESPGGYTPTGPALWDAYNYFAQNSPQYGGPQPQTGASSVWKNPMYRCYDANNDGTCQTSPTSEFELVPCAKNFVMLMTDGQWNRGGLPSDPYNNQCKISDDIETESPDPVVPAYYLHKNGFTNSQSGTPSVQGSVESVYAVGLWLSGTGEQAMKNVAMYGSFDRASKTWPGSTTGFPQGSCRADDCCNTTNCAKGSTCTALPPSSSDWDKDGDGVPDTFFKAEDATEIKEKIATAILDILRHVASGSAVSILASSEGSGANLLQAVYYPKKIFGATEVDWIGEMQNLWYYVDPNFQTSSIREDTNISGTSDANILNLASDYALELFYDTDGKTKARRYSTDVQGGSKTYVDTVLLEDINDLWKAGMLLFQRNLTSSPRTIYTTTNGSSFLTNNFSTTNNTALKPYLQATDDAEATKIIDYVHGTDQIDYRSRTVTIGGTTGVWRLGDIVDSSPSIQSSIPVGSFHKAPPDGYSDSSYLAYTRSSTYSGRGMAYAGGNDGMLHAFKHGKLEQAWTGKGTNDKARLANPDTTTALGSEVWAFIPKNSLPYLKYMTDPDYCHLYFVDAPNLIIDASIGDSAASYSDPKPADGSSWKTILIGGMGLGGASRITSASCTTGAAGTCVKTPVIDPADSSKGLGYSSYFALDVTSPNSPSLLWEFSNPDLGFSTSGPAIIRIGNPFQNGKWFAVFASGPTGPIEPNYRQFLGKSDQHLRIFVVDLKTGTLVRTIDTGIANAFGGSLYNATLDTDRGDKTSAGRYSDDILYLGYTKQNGTVWTSGGVIRITTKEDINPNNWGWSTVIDNIGPITAAVTKLQDRTKRKLWLYFGTGRFFYRLGATTDDASGQQAVYGLQEPCYNTATGPVNDIDNTCTSSLTITNLDDKTSDTSSSTLTSSAKGWYVNLAAASGNIGGERVITEPLAISSGAVFFTTYTPSTDTCSVGGNTNIWATKYDSGTQVYVEGVAITQVSTGAVHQLNLGTVFTERGGRRSAGITGMPPKGQGLSVVVRPKPLRKILQMKEK